MEQLESAGVNKYVLIIDSSGRALSFATSETEDKHVNKTTGKTWSLDIPSITPVGINDYFFYIKNTGQENIGITDIRLIGAAATLIDVDKVSGTPIYVVGTDITPLSRNTGKQPALTSIIKFDADITGLTDEGRWFPMQIQGATTLEHLSTSSNIILEPGGAMALKSSVATALEGTVSITILSEKAT